MKTANLTVQEILTIERTILSEKISPNFQESIRLRFTTAMELMSLPAENMELIFCHSAEKQTCMTTSAGKTYIIFDQHQAETLDAMNILYYLCGLPSIKQPFYKLLFAKNPDIIQPRLDKLVLQLLAEQSLLLGHSAEAELYTRASQNIQLPNFTDHSKNEEALAFSLLYLKTERAETARIFLLNFFVFHEMSHVKYQQTPTEFTILLEKIQRRSFGKISPTECACDIYSLEKLLEFSKYEYAEEIIESAMTALIHLALLDTLRTSELTDINSVFYTTIDRLNVDIGILNERLAANTQQAELMYTIEKTARSVFEKYWGFLETFETSWQHCRLK